jgi:hypothetical protein
MSIADWILFGAIVVVAAIVVFLYENSHRRKR